MLDSARDIPDLWRISTRQLGDLDMDLMIEILTNTLAPEVLYRCEAREHPYTLNGRQVDVWADGEWVEVWECGLAHPDALNSAGLEGYSGLALGMGLDRLLMLKKHIPDIRLLRSGDPRGASQMIDSTQYRPVPNLPSIRRDLSVAVDEHDSAEDIGDRVRDELGDYADVVEQVTVVSVMAHSELPRAAIERLGMTEGQKNLLVSIIIRSLERTLVTTMRTTFVTVSMTPYIKARIISGQRRQLRQDMNGVRCPPENREGWWRCRELTASQNPGWEPFWVSTSAWTPGTSAVRVASKRRSISTNR